MGLSNRVYEEYKFNRDVVTYNDFSVTKYINVINISQTRCVDKSEAEILVGALKADKVTDLCDKFFESSFAEYNLVRIFRCIYKKENAITISEFLNQDIIKFLAQYNIQEETIIKYKQLILSALNFIFLTKRTTLHKKQREGKFVVVEKNLPIEEQVIVDYRKGLSKSWLKEEFVVRHWNDKVLNKIFGDYHKYGLSSYELYQIIYPNRSMSKCI